MNVFDAVLSVLLIFSSIIDNLNAVSNSSSCGQTTFAANSGSIIFGPKSGSSGKRCTYNIRVRNGLRIVLEWSKFIVNGDMPRCGDSSVKVYIGCNSRKVLVSDFCSKNTASLPHDIYTIDECMEIEFYSTQSSSESFGASYKTALQTQPVSSLSSCRSSSTLYSKSGVIYSPKWPAGYPSMWKDCEWKIKVPLDYVIKMNFMDVSIYKTGSWSCQSSSERLRLKGEKSVLTSYKNKNYYCGTMLPFSKTTRYYELELEFKTRGYARSSNRGFIVGYIAYKTPETSKAAKKATKMAFIGLAIALVVLIGCCGFFCYRRRQRRLAQSGTYQSTPTQPAAMTTVTQTKQTSYGTGAYPTAAPPPQGGVPPPGAPPPYSAASNMPPYQGYPPPQHGQPPAPYPTGGAQYPPTSAAAPYPPTSAAAPYPGAAAPYPGAAAPYPGPAAPYPGAAAPAPYPTESPYPEKSAAYQGASAPPPPTAPGYPPN
eukprot:Seg381.9 transcript_id=Seg381.9/GoldUCD/mRNA.D3Y31 product="hypothetical protein" protein_id=Seg381.9/GoldUCD/D3Y31